MKNFPITLGVATIAILAHAIPGIDELLQLDFASVELGQWWRMWTGHATHFGTSHLTWDLLMFVALGGICERRHSKSYAAALAAMMLGISLTIRFSCPDILFYRGLSGIDTGLFVWFLVDQCRQSWHFRERLGMAAWTIMGVALIGKLLFELSTGQTLFVSAGPFRPLVESHFAGAMIGMLIGLIATVFNGKRIQAICSYYRLIDMSSSFEFGSSWKDRNTVS